MTTSDVTHFLERLARGRCENEFLWAPSFMASNPLQSYSVASLIKKRLLEMSVNKEEKSCQESKKKEELKTKKKKKKVGVPTATLGSGNENKLKYIQCYKCGNHGHFGCKCPQSRMIEVD
eukprot:PhF_6_TR37301/c0_g2_i3/m.54965